MNIPFLRSWLTDFYDSRLCDFLEFGFPLGIKDCESVLRDISKKELWKFKNHKGAFNYPNEITKYLEKEALNKAIIGPFKNNPFSSGMKISPLNSVPKKESSDRRVILDLSFPKGNSVNDYINKKEYLDEKVEIVFPKVDDFVQLIKAKGRGCLLYKCDLARAYRQIPICPSSFNYVAFCWKKHIYFDSVLTMGSRSAAYCCQLVTNAIVFMLFKIGISVLNYLDDLASAEKPDLANFGFAMLREILNKCGIKESVEKASPPATIMTFIGILFNTEKMTVEVTSERLAEIGELLKLWLNKESASIREIQSLLGKLNFVAACVKPGRIFISRMLKWLKILYHEDSNCEHQIPYYVKKDLQWWNRFLLTYNGISMMMTEEFSKPDEVFSTDSCLTACGGYWQGNYFHAKFPEKISELNFSINILEMLSIIICLRLWGHYFRGKRIRIFCDNASVCSVVNSGRARCEELQSCLRELAFLCAINECEIRAVHLDSRSNRLSDLLSRWYENDSNRQQFFLLTKNCHLREYSVHDELFDFINNW